MKFLHQRGFTWTSLRPADFSDTGRGLQTLTTAKPGKLLISLPETCLLTTSTVLSSYLGPYIKVWTPRLSPLLVLCVFLVLERHSGPLSQWSPYIDVLPTEYTCPVYFTDEVINLLPLSVRRRALEQRTAVQELHSTNHPFFRSLQPLLDQPVEEVLTNEALKWAWCSVNTRSVFMSHSPNHFLSGQDVYALAPFLDLLNHRPDVQVSAVFNNTTRCYEIQSVSGIRCYEQAFINYGSHDNQRLLLEYGFVASNNPHSVVYVEPDLLQKLLPRDRSLEHKMKFLRENQFLHNLTVSSEGPGWRLLAALRVLCLPQELYHQWRTVLLGQRLSEEREDWCFLMVQTLCRHLLQDTDSALEEISQLQVHSDLSRTRQLDVVKALRQEERCILGEILESTCGRDQNFS